jgi:hypothetical protein
MIVDIGTENSDKESEYVNKFPEGSRTMHLNRSTVQ